MKWWKTSRGMHNTHPRKNSALATPESPHACGVTGSEVSENPEENSQNVWHPSWLHRPRGDSAPGESLAAQHRDLFARLREKYNRLSNKAAAFCDRTTARLRRDSAIDKTVNEYANSPSHQDNTVEQVDKHCNSPEYSPTTRRGYESPEYSPQTRPRQAAHRRSRSRSPQTPQSRSNQRSRTPSRSRSTSPTTSATQERSLTELGAFGRSRAESSTRSRSRSSSTEPSQQSPREYNGAQPRSIGDASGYSLPAEWEPSDEERGESPRGRSQEWKRRQDNAWQIVGSMDRR